MRSRRARALQSFKSSSFRVRQVIDGKQRVGIGDQLFNVRLVGARHLVDIVAVHGVGQMGDLIRNLCDAFIQVLALCSRLGQLVPFLLGGFAVVKCFGDVENLPLDCGYRLRIARFDIIDRNLRIIGIENGKTYYVTKKVAIRT